MYVIIVGGGNVGLSLGRKLLYEGHEVLIIEREQQVSEAIVDELGNIVLQGDGCEVATLNKAGVKRADIFIAVTGGDEDNLVACQVARHIFQVPKTIAMVRNSEYDRLFKMLGVDVVIRSTDTLVEQIRYDIPSYLPFSLFTSDEDDLTLIGVTISAPSRVVGKTLDKLGLPSGCEVVLIVRNGGKITSPGADTLIEAGDKIIAALPASMEKGFKLTGV